MFHGHICCSQEEDEEMAEVGEDGSSSEGAEETDEEEEEEELDTVSSLFTSQLLNHIMACVVLTTDSIFIFTLF